MTPEREREFELSESRRLEKVAGAKGACVVAHCRHNNVDRHGECRQCIDWQRHKCVFPDPQVAGATDVTLCVCHQGSVCTADCARFHHEGCPQVAGAEGEQVTIWQWDEEEQGDKFLPMPVVTGATSLLVRELQDGRACGAYFLTERSALDAARKHAREQAEKWLKLTDQIDARLEEIGDVD